MNWKKGRLRVIITSHKWPEIATLYRAVFKDGFGDEHVLFLKSCELTTVRDKPAIFIELTNGWIRRQARDSEYVYYPIPAHGAFEEVKNGKTISVS